jgi:RNA polymerase sigma-70 factor (ECF subfamily)
LLFLTLFGVYFSAFSRYIEKMQKQVEIEKLFHKYYARLRLMADRLLHDGEESKDVVSDVFTRLLQADDLPEAGIAEGYLVCSVRNRCMDILAHRQVRQRVERLLPIDNSLYISESCEAQRYAELQHYVDTQLPAQTRQVFLLRFEKHLKYQEIAAELGVSKKTVYVHLQQAISQLHNHFNAKGI